MAAESYFFDQIDDFLTGKLAPADHAAMEKAILEHTDLAQEVGLRRLEFEVSESLIARDIRAQLAQLRQQTPAPAAAPATGNNRKKILITLFVLALAGLLAWSISRVSQRPSPPPVPPPSTIPPAPNDTLPAIQPTDAPQANTAPAPTPPVASDYPKRLALATSVYSRPDFEQVRGSAAAPDSFDMVLDAWHKTDYTTVQKAAAKISAQSPMYIKSRYIQAHAFFLSRDYRRAAEVFGQVADSSMLPYSEEADWYVILALLSQKNVDQQSLRQRMKRILESPNHTYFEGCKRLSEKL
jgi:hypothetical protein